MTQPEEIPSAADEINRLHTEAVRCVDVSRGALQAALLAAWRAGQLLVDEKQRVRTRMGETGWLLWLKAKFRGTPRTAQRYMKLARSVSDPKFLHGMSLRQAYLRLGIATEPKPRTSARLQHGLPSHVVLANKLVRELRKKQRTRSSHLSFNHDDLRELYNCLHRLFEPDSSAPSEKIKLFALTTK